MGRQGDESSPGGCDATHEGNEERGRLLPIACLPAQLVPAPGRSTRTEGGRIAVPDPGAPGVTTALPSGLGRCGTDSERHPAAVRDHARP
jgi:hypothetical protein